MRRALKFKNIPVLLSGVRFDSKKEAKQYQELQLREKAGEITDLKRQVPFRCNVNGFHICTWRADYVYFDQRERRLVIRDAKGYRTPIYKLKRRLVEACHGIQITET